MINFRKPPRGALLDEKTILAWRDSKMAKLPASQ
jgi:hypothetical protein